MNNIYLAISSVAPSGLIFGDARYPGVRAARSTPGWTLTPRLGSVNTPPRLQIAGVVFFHRLESFHIITRFHHDIGCQSTGSPAIFIIKRMDCNKLIKKYCRLYRLRYFLICGVPWHEIIHERTDISIFRRNIRRRARDTVVNRKQYARWSCKSKTLFENHFSDIQIRNF